MEKCKLFFFGKTPGTSLTGFRVSGAGCRRVPGFYKVLIWGGRGRSAPRVSSGIERGLPPNLQVHQPSRLPAVSAARRLRALSVGLPEFAAHHPSILRVGQRRGSPGIERETAPKFAAHRPLQSCRIRSATRVSGTLSAGCPKSAANQTFRIASMVSVEGLRGIERGTAPNRQHISPLVGVASMGLATWGLRAMSAGCRLQGRGVHGCRFLISADIRISRLGLQFRG